MPDLQWGYFDTNWPGNPKVRKLMKRNPTEWPKFWCAFMALWGDCWAHRTRQRDFEDALPVGLDVESDAAKAALMAVGLLDRQGRIPKASWDEWFGPVQARINQATKAAEMRWHSGSNAPALPQHSGSNADRGIDREKKNGSRKVTKGLTSIRDLLPPPPGYDERGEAS